MCVCVLVNVADANCELPMTLVLLPMMIAMPAVTSSMHTMQLLIVYVFAIVLVTMIGADDGNNSTKDDDSVHFALPIFVITFTTICLILIDNIRNVNKLKYSPNNFVQNVQN